MLALRCIFFSRMIFNVKGYGQIFMLAYSVIHENSIDTHKQEISTTLLLEVEIFIRCTLK